MGRLHALEALSTILMNDQVLESVHHSRVITAKATRGFQKHPLTHSHPPEKSSTMYDVKLEHLSTGYSSYQLFQTCKQTQMSCPAATVKTGSVSTRSSKRGPWVEQ